MKFVGSYASCKISCEGLSNIIVAWSISDDMIPKNCACMCTLHAYDDVKCAQLQCNKTCFLMLWNEGPLMAKIIVVKLFPTQRLRCCLSCTEMDGVGHTSVKGI